MRRARNVNKERPIMPIPRRRPLFDCTPAGSLYNSLKRETPFLARRRPRRVMIRFKLSVMMFLQFFIWGAWYELNFGYVPSLGFNAEWQQPLIFGAFNLAALVAMFFGTQFVD